MSTASSWRHQSKVLCSIPVAVLVIIAALDSGDKALLGASFPMLEKTLGLHGKIIVMFRFILYCYECCMLRHIAFSLFNSYLCKWYHSYSWYIGIFQLIHKFIICVMSSVVGLSDTSLYYKVRQIVISLNILLYKNLLNHMHLSS